MKPMKPGRELDAVIAEKVLGLNLESEQNPDFGDGLMVRVCEPKTIQTISGPYRENGLRPLPHYSASMSAAWAVVEQLREKGIYFATTNCHERWDVWLSVNPIDDLVGEATASSVSLPLAICLAALKAIEQ